MIGVVFSVLAGCAPKATCVTEQVGSCASVEKCCTEEECHYEADGETFVCDGLDCSAAAVDVATHCSG